MSSLDISEIENLYRFARIFSDSEEEATELVARILDRASRTHDENARQLFSAVWQSRDPARSSSTGLPTFLNGLTPVQRAGCSLHYLLDLPPSEIARICGLTPNELEDALRNCPPEEEARAALQTLRIDADHLADLLAESSKPAEPAAPGFKLWSPVGLALLFSTVVLMAVGAWTFTGHHAYEDLPAGRKFFERAENIAAENLESVNVPAGDLADWLFVKHGIENAQVPPAIAALEAVRCGPGQIENHPVTQIALKESPSLIFLFRAADFELEDRPPGEWSVFSEGEWAGAIQVQNGQACAVVMEGTEAEMRSFLANHIL